ncbi:MAG: GxxExxY protein [Spirochaetes bacterium GWF1_41_5]|nr:MAG: GxxExxY protein [Spirochaetes bacterium GWF1_41_5]
MVELLFKDITDKIIKAFYDVYNELGRGFLENVYENAMMITLKEQGLGAEQQKGIDVYFRNNLVGEYRADIIVEDKIILELKACRTFAPEHEAQIINYLKATGMSVGMLLNFGDKPEFRRVVYDSLRK